MLWLYKHPKMGQQGMQMKIQGPQQGGQVTLALAKEGRCLFADEWVGEPG